MILSTAVITGILGTLWYYGLIDLYTVGYWTFDHLTNLYTYCRLWSQQYDPFKPRLHISKIVLHFCPETKTQKSQSEPLGSHRIVLNPDHSLSQPEEIIALANKFNYLPIAMSLHYSYSDWNEKVIKLIDLQPQQERIRTQIRENKIDELGETISGIMLMNKPEYNPLNYDYQVKIQLSRNIDLTDPKHEVEGIKNLEAYIRRSTTWETEQTLRLLSERGELMEFIYPDLERIYAKGYLSFVAEDELGTEFSISMR